MYKVKKNLLDNTVAVLTWTQNGMQAVEITQRETPRYDIRTHDIDGCHLACAGTLDRSATMDFR